MTNQKITAIANPNIAFIKYWGNRDHDLRIPSNGSISMNLAGLETRTTVAFDAALPADRLTLNGKVAGDEAVARVSTLLARVRQLAGIDSYAQVTSENNFPTGSGIASSASAFAALSLAATTAAGLNLPEDELSRLARTGSGSASRSIPGGFVEWLPGHDHHSSYAHSIATPDHWALADCVAIVSQRHKSTGSSHGHPLAETSPLQNARLADIESRLDICRQAIMDRDFEAFATVVELDSNIMHAVMISSTPTLMYWEPASLTIMKAVQQWRAEGLPVCYTLDAGPNVHVLCEQSVQAKIERQLQTLPGVLEVKTALPGGPARLI